MREIQEFVKNLEIGDMQSYRNLTVIPLLGKDSALDYLVLSDALGSGFNIREKRSGASVPILYAENSSGKEVLAIAGEYVVGGLQNRTLTRNAYFSKEFSGEIPVRCVQSGRWNYNPDWDFRVPEDVSGGHIPIREFPGHRRTPMHETVFRLGGVAPIMAHHAESQGETWGAVEEFLSDAGVRSGSRDLHEVYTQRREDFERYMQNFPVIERQVGNLAVFSRGDEKRFIVDAFDSQKTLRKYFGNLLKSYALEAGLNREEKTEVSEQEARGFLDSVDSCNFENTRQISLGQDFKINGESLDGTSLLYERQAVYFNLFTKPKKTEKREQLGETRNHANPLSDLRIGGFGRTFYAE